MNLTILKNLAKPTYLLIMMGAALLFFDLHYYFMKSLPGSDGFQCLEGVNLTMTNLFFAGGMSVLFGIMIAGLLALYQIRHGGLIGSSMMSGLGVILGTLTVFCTICTIPVISLFGFSIGLAIFSTHSLIFKFMSLKLMLTGLYLLNRKLANNCEVCALAGEES